MKFPTSRFCLAFVFVFVFVCDTQAQILTFKRFNQTNTDASGTHSGVLWAGDTAPLDLETKNTATDRRPNTFNDPDRVNPADYALSLTNAGASASFTRGLDAGLSLNASSKVAQSWSTIFNENDANAPVWTKHASSFLDNWAGAVSKYQVENSDPAAPGPFLAGATLEISIGVSANLHTLRTGHVAGVLVGNSYIDVDYDSALEQFHISGVWYKLSDPDTPVNIDEHIGSGYAGEIPEICYENGVLCISYPSFQLVDHGDIIDVNSNAHLITGAASVPVLPIPVPTGWIQGPGSVSCVWDVEAVGTLWSVHP